MEGKRGRGKEDILLTRERIRLREVRDAGKLEIG